MDAARRDLAQLVTAIDPFDAIESEHRAAALDWIASDAPLYRTAPPDQPPVHLVSYFVPVDSARRTVMLVGHRKSGLDLPPGGHCEPGESPWTTVARECVEELAVPAVPLPWAGTAPLFITVTKTRPPHEHTDVSLWHLIAVDADNPRLRPGPREFTGARWVGLEDLLREPIASLDPHTHRFAAKFSEREAAAR